MRAADDHRNAGEAVQAVRAYADAYYAMPEGVRGSALGVRTVRLCVAQARLLGKAERSGELVEPALELIRALAADLAAVESQLPEDLQSELEALEDELAAAIPPAPAREPGGEQAASRPVVEGSPVGPRDDVAQVEPSAPPEPRPGDLGRSVDARGVGLTLCGAAAFLGGATMVSIGAVWGRSEQAKFDQCLADPGCRTRYDAEDIDLAAMRDEWGRYRGGLIVAGGITLGVGVALAVWGATRLARERKSDGGRAARLGPTLALRWLGARIRF